MATDSYANCLSASISGHQQAVAVSADVARLGTVGPGLYQHCSGIAANRCFLHNHDLVSGIRHDLDRCIDS